MSLSSASRFGSRLSPLHIPGRRQSSSSISSSKSIPKEPCIHGPPLHPYYQTVPPSLRAKFGDLDEDGNYLIAEEAVLSPDTHNLVVDFGNDGAYVAVNVGLSKEDDIEGFLGPVNGSGRPKGLRTRWICIFAPHRQPNLVEAIGKRYGLSPRHITLLLSQPPDSVAYTPPHQSKLRRAGQRMAETFTGSKKSMERVNIEDLTTSDEVGLVALDTDGISLASVSKEAYLTPNLNTSYMSLVAKVWHWHAVEWGGRFLCVGYNSLHNLPSSPDSNSGRWSLRDNESNHSSKHSTGGLPCFAVDEAGGSDDDGSSHADTQENFPEGRRLWTWLILCDDGTIISLHEPHSHRTVPSALDYKGQIGIIRKNILTILRSLSRASEALNRTAIEKSKGLGALDELPFRRQGLTDLTESEPSLLFYYLFDDWYSSWSLAIERQHPYRRKLRKLRTDLIRDPELEHVDSLLRLARQLATLKRMYETYQLIIDRILYRQENSLSMAKGGGRVIVIGDPEKIVKSSDNPNSPESIIMGDPKILGVPLSSHAVARFERLRDRIKLYALAELQDCLDEKDGLVNMTFQLIAFKQTSAVEKMTRVAILFAGATILFLPLTLLTGFFSMEIDGMKDRWKPTHFWGASGVSILITICLLIVVVKYSAAIQTVKLGTEKAKAVGRAQGWWGRKKKSS